MPPNAKTLRMPPNILRKLDVHVVCSEKFREVGNGLEEALSYMFVDVVISLKITVTEANTGLTVRGSLMLQNKRKQSCVLTYKQGVPSVPSRNEVIQKLYEFVLIIQLGTFEEMKGLNLEGIPTVL